MSGLQHKHGGKLTVTGIGHGTYKRVAEWFYVGRVEWNDGTVSERTTIPPYAVCFDHDDAAAKAEYARVSAALDEYLRANGEWLKEPKRMRGGYIVHWIANKPDGEVSI